MAESPAPIACSRRALISIPSRRRTATTPLATACRRIATDRYHSHEHDRRGAREFSWQDRSPVQRLIAIEQSGRRERVVVVNLELIRIDHPHAIDSGMKIAVEPRADRLGLC